MSGRSRRDPTRRIAHGHLRGEAFSLYLKSIDIAGFKSFARPAKLELLPGITALVGPNGSGKSNVVDAIRWCLGEQSMRDLRGQRAEDVIHAGAKRTLGAAEVTLTFEASATDAAAQLASLSVARRLYRSGDSEYLVNGKRARLRDVQDALRSVDIDGTRNVVVNQGMADALLAASPAERRLLLEQAAGLGGYRARRDEARQKLQTTGDNVATMRMILGELEPRLRLLRRQSRAVQDRETAQLRLETALTSWYALRWSMLNKRIAARAADLQRATVERTRQEEDLRDLEGQTEQQLTVQRKWQLRVESADAAFRTLRADLDLARDGVRQAEGRRDASARQSRDLADRRELLSQRLLRNQVQLRETEVALEARSAALAVIQAAVDAASAGRATQTKIVEGLDRQSTSRRASINQLEIEHTRANRERDSAAHERDFLATRLAETIARTDHVRASLEESKTARASVATSLEGAVIEAQRLQKRLDALREEVQIATSRSARLKALTSAVRARVSQAERQSSLESRTASSLQSEVGGTLLETLRVADRWSTAVASALGSWAAAGTDAARTVPWSAARRAEYLAWRSTISAGLPTDPVWADGVVEGVDPDWPSPLCGTILVFSRNEIDPVWRAIELLPGAATGNPGVQVAAADGTVRTASGTQQALGDDRAVRYLQLAASVARLERRLAIARPRLGRLEREESRVQSALSSSQQTLREEERDARAVQDAVTTLQASLRAAEREIEHGTTELERLAGAAGQLQNSAEENRARLERADAALAAAEVAVSHARDAAIADETELTMARKELRAALDHEMEVVRARVAAETSISELRAAIASILRERQEIGTEQDRVLEAITEAVASETRAQEALAGALAKTEDVAVLAGDQERHVAEMRAEQPPVLALGSLAEPRQRLTALVGVEERASAQMAVVRDERDLLHLEIRRELGQEPESLPIPLDEEPPTDDEIRRLRSRANQYADADVSVVTECAELEQRYENLSIHAEDLTRAADELQAIIETTDAEMHSRFAGAFAAVNQEFGRVFGMMLPGGTASLELADADGGVLVQAQLPGKRSRSSTAFSGGERSLVASCLLFGVLTIRPTPFCVLDEVDAALDESNVDRYLAALRDIARRTQIVVVTHNRATMAAADALYGLTMDDDGASGLLSLRLETYQPASV